MLQAALKEKVLEEEESFQNHQKRMKEEKARTLKEKTLHGELRGKQVMYLENTPRDGLGMVFCRWGQKA